ncbi:TPA: hypothetical protein EYP44_02590 [Candidatus Bathyarchaeota archaeon]|nr:hypothetical protein [Candidatus Bathyarchaeota archaeon]
MARRRNRAGGLVRSAISHLKGALGTSLRSIHLIDVRIGQIYTGVVLSTGHGGVAYNFSGEAGCQPVDEAGSISGKTADLALAMAEDRNLAKASVGIAVANALSSLVFQRHGRYRFVDVDVLDLIRRGDRIVMVGYFLPLIPRVRSKASALHVLERRPILDRGVSVLPEEEADEVIPEADAVVITGSTIVNKTIDRLLGLCRGAREVVILGPTASLVPDALFDRGVTAEMGIRVTDSRAMIGIVGEGGGTRQLLRSAEKMALLKTEEMGQG